jgi:hypothetical protein
MINELAMFPYGGAWRVTWNETVLGDGLSESQAEALCAQFGNGVEVVAR